VSTSQTKLHNVVWDLRFLYPWRWWFESSELLRRIAGLLIVDISKVP